MLRLDPADANHIEERAWFEGGTFPVTDRAYVAWKGRVYECRLTPLAVPQWRYNTVVILAKPDEPIRVERARMLEITNHPEFQRRLQAAEGLALYRGQGIYQSGHYALQRIGQGLEPLTLEQEEWIINDLLGPHPEELVKRHERRVRELEAQLE